MIYKFF